MRILPFLLFLGVLTSCYERNPTTLYNYNKNPLYTWGYAEFYGNYYAHQNENINHVISLSLFSDSLYVNDEGGLAGFGQYLFLEDVFVSENDTILPAGTYTVSKSGEAYTIAPGENFKVDKSDYPIGGMIYFIEKNAQRSKSNFITEGSMTVEWVAPANHKITCQFILDDRTTLKGTFNAVLSHFNQAVDSQPQSVRKRIKVNL